MSKMQHIDDLPLEVFSQDAGSVHAFHCVTASVNAGDPRQSSAKQEAKSSRGSKVSQQRVMIRPVDIYITALIVALR